MHHPLSCLPWGSELLVSHYPHSRATYDEQYAKIFKFRIMKSITDFNSDATANELLKSAIPMSSGLGDVAGVTSIQLVGYQERTSKAGKPYLLFDASTQNGEKVSISAWDINAMGLTVSETPQGVKENGRVPFKNTYDLLWSVRKTLPKDAIVASAVSTDCKYNYEKA